MHRYYLVRLLLTPSTLSGALCVFLAASVLGVTVWSFISERQLFYDYLFGVYGFNTLLLVQDTGSLQVIQRAIFNSDITYHILIVLCSLIVGALVYILLEGMRSAARQTSVAWRQLHMLGSPYSQAAHQNLARQFLRIAALVGWALYLIIFMSVLLPTILVLARAGTDSINLGETWGLVNLLESFALLVISLHIHVVFLRLTVLRPRVFGVGDIEIAEQHKLG